MTQSNKAQMADETYHYEGWRIRVMCDLDAESGKFKARSFVSAQLQPEVSASHEPFSATTSIEAKGYALQAAKRYIDALRSNRL